MTKALHPVHDCINMRGLNFTYGWASPVKASKRWRRTSYWLQNAWKMIHYKYYTK